MMIKLSGSAMLDNYNEIWGRVRESMEKKIISEPLYNKEYIKAKMKIATDFYDQKKS